MNKAVVSKLPPRIAEPVREGAPRSPCSLPQSRDFGSLRASLIGLRDVILTY